MLRNSCKAEKGPDRNSYRLLQLGPLMRTEVVAQVLDQYLRWTPFTEILFVDWHLFFGISFQVRNFQVNVEVVPVCKFCPKQKFKFFTLLNKHCETILKAVCKPYNVGPLFMERFRTKFENLRTTCQPSYQQIRFPMVNFKFSAWIGIVILDLIKFQNYVME